MSFIRLTDHKEQKEKLFSVGHIWKIEVQYVTVDQNGVGWRNLLAFGANDPNALRLYHVYIGGDDFIVEPNPNSPAFKVIEEIYKNSIA